ncbi:MAG: hypothetical protein ACYCPA_10820 [Acidithiobacillus sp.]
MQHIGFLVVSNATFKDFRYPLMWDAERRAHAVKLPGRSTVDVSLKAAKKGSHPAGDQASLVLKADLDAETKAAAQKLWGK